MKRQAPVLLAAGLLLAVRCACLPAGGPGAPMPTVQVAQQATIATPPPIPSTAGLPGPLGTPRPAARPTMPAPSPTAFGLVSIPRATVTYYDVAGDTAGELRAGLDALGPIGRDGKHWDAICNWDYWWSWPGGADGGCDLAAATVTCEVRVTFPRWAPPEGAPPDLAARWASFAQALAVHELGHVDRAIAGVASIEEAVRGAGCDTANTAAEAAVARVQALNDAYDAETDHGLGQGVVFP